MCLVFKWTIWESESLSLVQAHRASTWRILDIFFSSLMIISTTHFIEYFLDANDFFLGIHGYFTQALEEIASMFSQRRLGRSLRLNKLLKATHLVTEWAGFEHSSILMQCSFVCISQGRAQGGTIRRIYLEVLNAALEEHHSPLILLLVFSTINFTEIQAKFSVWA